MRKRFLRGAIVCAGVLVMVSMAAAQAPKPVTRMGDWVEVGNEVFMNLIATTDIRYYTNHNADFENDVRDRGLTRDPVSSAAYWGTGDFLEAEIRFGVDFRYQKNLRMRVLLEAQSIFDGILIDDDKSNTNSPGCNSSGSVSAGGVPKPATNPCPGAALGQLPFPGTSQQDNSVHVERFWIDYQFPRTPVHLRVGADLWFLDQARITGDDDPRITLYGAFGPLEWGVAAVIQNESATLGLANDNDYIYYTFHVAYNMMPHKVALDLIYNRDRFSGATGQSTITGQSIVGQKVDSVLIMPSWTGGFGPIRGLLQLNLVFGTAEGTSAAGNPDFDIFAWGIVAGVEADLGLVRPFIGVIFGSGDDDANDHDLNGFFTMTRNDITLIEASPFFNYLGTSPTVHGFNAPPAMAILGGEVGHHTTGSPYFDRLGNAAHTTPAGVVRISSTYSNPGTLLIPVGLRISPLRGHYVVGYYMYVGMMDTSILETIAAANAAAGIALPVRGGSISKTYFHEVGLVWRWVLSQHFDVTLTGIIMIPGGGVKDVASTVDCGGGIGCKGEDVALNASAMFRGRF